MHMGHIITHSTPSDLRNAAPGHRLSIRLAQQHRQQPQLSTGGVSDGRAAEQQPACGGSDAPLACPRGVEEVVIGLLERAVPGTQLMRQSGCEMVFRCGGHCSMI